MCFTPGERCEDRGRTYQETCANECPRSCTDLWDHVQCLQGACHPGCALYICSKALIDQIVSLFFSLCFLLSQDVAVLRACCCRMVCVFRCQTVAVVSHQATAHWSSSPKRKSQLTVIPGRNDLVLIEGFCSVDFKGITFTFVFFLVASAATPVCVRMALWCAPNFPAQCTIAGARGAPAQFPVDRVKELEVVSAGTQRADLPALTPKSQRTVTCQHVQV